MLYVVCVIRVHTGAILNTSGRGTALTTVCPNIKLSRLISSKTCKAFYDGRHYSLRGGGGGDIIHGGTVFTPTPE